MPTNSTQLMVEAGEILQTLTPARFATLIFVYDDDLEQQTEMADTLGRSTSAITTYLQSLNNLPMPLVTKHGTRYTVTSAGESVLDLYSETIGRLGADLREIDWGVKSDRNQVGTLLEPLHKSRSAMPFFVLHSIGTRSEAGGSIDRVSDGTPVPVDSVVDDATARLEKRGESASEKQVRWTVSRFEETDIVATEDDGITLTEKGFEQFRLLSGLVRFLEKHRQEEERSHGSNGTESETDLGIDDVRIQPDHDSEGLYGQMIVPAYCRGVSSGNLPEPAVSLPPTTTVDDLLEQLHDLKREHGGDTALELHWSLWEDTAAGVRTYTED